MSEYENDFQPSFGEEGTFTHDNLIAGGPIKTDEGVLVSGQNLTRGAVLGKITASGKLTLSDDGAADGSEVPFSILAIDCDASAADKACIQFISGEFNQEALTLGGAHTAASIKDGLRDLGIYLKASQEA